MRLTHQVCGQHGRYWPVISSRVMCRPRDRVVPSQVVVRCRNVVIIVPLPRVPRAQSACISALEIACQTPRIGPAPAAATGSSITRAAHVNPAPLQPPPGPPACSQRRSLDRSCAHELVPAMQPKGRIRVIAFQLRVDWSIGRLGYRQRMYTNGSDAQTALRWPSCGQKRDQTVFRAPSAGGPKCEQTCSQPPLGAILSSQPLTMSIYDAYAPLERMGTVWLLSYTKLLRRNTLVSRFTGFVIN